MSVQFLIGDVREKLKELAAESIQCVVTSPPYWAAQRDYGHEKQMGMESTPEEYVDVLAGVFDEVARVLKPNGVMWLNIGDSYAASGKGGGGSLVNKRGGKWDHRKELKGWRAPPPGYKQKDLVGVPWLLAFRLRSAGWYLRRDIVWNKQAATEPARADRPSVSHELIFLFSKSKTYQLNPVFLPHGTVWHVSPQGYEGHVAAFPPKLIEPCIMAGSMAGETVLDPFGGSGTTGMVADRLRRHAILIELNPEYAALADRRIKDDRGGLVDLMEAS